MGQQPSQPCLAMTLFDLSKPFDLLVRADAWKAVGRLAEDASIEFFLEELHRGGLLDPERQPFRPAEQTHPDRHGSQTRFRGRTSMFF